MERLCERPGCSDTASVAYGMRPEDLVFWLDRLDGTTRDGNVLCQRHADAMIVPRNWTLDDLRDPDLHLFRPPAPEPVLRRSRRSASSSKAVDRGEPAVVEQLELGGVSAETTPDVASEQGTGIGGDPPTEIGPETGSAADTIADLTVAPAGGESWSPSFDDGDDLDGLLSARSPLLARAFRGDDRPRG